MGDSVQVRVLGPVDVTVSGVPRAVRGLRRKAVLAVLGLHVGEIVSTDRLIMQNLGPVAAARAEAAWLRGDPGAIVPLIEPVYRDAHRLGVVDLRAELGYWLTAAGQPVPADDSGHPYALLAAGRFREAAAIWRDAGCTYEHAAALAASTDPDDLRTALAALDARGAEPLARRVRATR